ncbi:MAG: polyketide synthase, partial [Pirellulaceae bacterium]|nr:polyketide synthase [Pirellulaceae bacterium]
MSRRNLLTAMSSQTQQTEQNQNWMHQPLAIVGMACRLPGGDDLQQFWQMLRNGQHGIDRFPETFFDRELYYSPEKGVRGKSYADVGGLIADRPLDWSIMPVPASEASHWDPCHLILTEVTAAACIHAGYDPRNMPDRRAGVYIGHSGGSTRGGEIAYHTLLTDYVDLLEDLPPWQSMSESERDEVRSQLLDRLRATRRARTPDGGPMVDAGCAAGLLSRAFGLSGPHMSIDAACASSLVALALSATALHTGQIDMAIVGGASYNKFDSLILFSQAQSCSPNSSRPFDAAADGLISSEGYVVFIMKTLAKAQADGDRIEAVIRGIGVSSDGRGRSLWAPRKEGQYTAIERAYAPDVTADSVQMVEAHATSTQVGDATEMDALSSFFRERLAPGKRIPVGSVKSNIGHTLETAGLAGVLKAVLSIQHKTIPPSINVQ